MGICASCDVDTYNNHNHDNNNHNNQCHKDGLKIRCCSKTSCYDGYYNYNNYFINPDQTVKQYNNNPLPYNPYR